MPLIATSPARHADPRPRITPEARPGGRIIFDATVLSNWLPPPTFRPSEWAAAHVDMPRGQSPRPGPLDHRNAPYLPGIIDLALAPGVQQLNVMKSAQVGVSEAIRWLIGYIAASEPDPLGLALPDRDKGEKIIQNRVIPLFQRTRPLRELSSGMPHDAKKQQIRLRNGFILHLMWSGSPSAMASDPMRVVINDEVDKFAAWAGREAHPVQLTAQRLEAFGDRGLQINVSTPTTRSGMMFQLWDQSSVKLYYLVECPHCRHRIRLLMPNVRFGLPDKSVLDLADRATRADYIEHHQTAWYQCQSCGGRIDENDRRRICLAGKWGTADDLGVATACAGENDPAGEPPRIADALAVRSWPAGTRLGLQISRLYTMWRHDILSVLAARFTRAVGSYELQLAFRTQDLGEQFEDKTTRLDTSIIAGRCSEAALPEGVLPDWTARIVIAIDTQIDGFYAVVRAWGPGGRSHRVYHAPPDQLHDFEALDALIAKPWSYPPDSPFAAHAPRVANLVVIDTGAGRARRMLGESDQDYAGRPSRTQEVYAWCLRHQEIVRPIKGMNEPKPGDTFRLGAGVYAAGGVEQKIPVWLIHSDHYQNCLEAAIIATVPRPPDPATGEVVSEPAWQCNNRNDPNYNAHLNAMVKVPVRRGPRMVEEWQRIASGARIDYRMCEVYQMAGGEMAGVHLLPGLDEFLAQSVVHHAAAQQVAERRRRPNAPFTMPDGRPFLATER